MNNNLYQQARLCLDAADPDEKLALTEATLAAWKAGQLFWDLAEDENPVVVSLPIPGRPDKPKLVSPRDLAKRGFNTRPQRAALIHALAHIEFNAVNLGWDAVYRFRGMPKAFYDDWIDVAVDEAKHFSMLRERLRALDYEYGDFPAHNGLWEMAVKTEHDIVARMALVPRVLEARSLDVVPGIIRKLRAVGDDAMAEVLEVIEADEISHVAAGSRWFNFTCEQQNKNPLATFQALLTQYMQGSVRGPFSVKQRVQAGFTIDEITMLEEFGG